MELRHLNLVVTLAGEGTLTSAGKKLYLSQSALSRQLREIEDELGAPLFRRVKKRMVLTTEGKRVLEGANAVLGEVRRVREDVRCMTVGDVGTLRLGACSHTCFHWLPAVLQSFKGAHPGVEVQIDTAAAHDPAAHLTKGVIDLAIVNIKPIETRISYKKLFDDEMFAVVPKDHSWAGKTHVTARHFAEEHLINYDYPIEEVVFYQRVLLPAGVTPKSLTKLPMTDAIVEMVKAGMGVAVLNHWSIRPFLETNKDLRAIRVTKNGLKRTWYAARRRDERQPPYVSAFIDHLARHAKR
jgi:LysR family transcriptional regulator for metE and metH